MINKKQISYRLADAVRGSGKSYRQVEEETGISLNTLNHYINKGGMPGADKLARLCHALGVSADWVLGLRCPPDIDARGQREEAVFRQDLEKFGWESQRAMLFEEMAELQEAVCKEARGRDTREHLAEEVADVEIMLEQVKLHFDVEGLVKKTRGEKVKRLRGRVEKYGDEK